MSGRDVVRLELVNGPELLLHPETALELLRSQQADGPQPRGPALGADEARVPTRLQWRGSENRARARGGAEAGGQAVLHAFSVIKDVAAEPLVSAAARRVDEQAPPGLFRLTSADPQGEGEPVGASAAAPGSVPAGPRLVLVHGTFSSTAGSFGRLWIEHPDQVRQLFRAYPGGVYGFQHATLQQSPLDNALALARQLPPGGPVHFLTHSRGGLVVEALVQLASRAPSAADLSFFDATTVGGGPAAPAGAQDEYARQGALLSEVATAARGMAIARVVRVACPARGTLLASRRLDAYLSILKWGLKLAQIPVAPALADLLLTFARVGRSAEVLPGLEAMTPDCPFLRWLCSSVELVPGDLRVVAGDLQGDSIGSWAKTLLADAFYWTDNDLVVQTRSMYGGAPRQDGSTFLLNRGGNVTHFSYFSHPATSAAITRALLDGRRVPDGFAAIGPESSDGLSSTGSRGGGPRALVGASRSPERPAVIVLPGVLGTNLAVGGHRVWLGVRIFNGLRQLAYRADDTSVQTDGLLGPYYDELVAHLAQSHEVIPFPFDWRKPIEVEAQRLAAIARAALDDRLVTRTPVRMIAHSMGGLVARALQLEAPEVWRDLMSHDDARLLMLGTPNAGSWAPMQALSGDDRLANLLGAVGTLFDVTEARAMFARLPGFLQLQAGLLDETNGLARSETWRRLADSDRQLWEVDLAWFQLDLQRKIAAWGIPPDDVLAQAKDLQARLAAQDLGEAKRRMLLVVGGAPRTACGYELGQAGRFEYQQTDRGDGTVPDASAVLAGVPTWRAAVEHADLPRHRELFPGFVELLARGATISQELKPLGTRSALAADADVGRVEDMPRTARSRGWTAEALDGLAGIDATMGAPLEERAGPSTPPASQVTPAIRVSVTNGDLTFIEEPLLLGHYRSLALTGAERVIDRFIGGTMSEALRLRRYPSATGESEVFENRQPNPDDRADVPRPSAVIVVGLGPEGELRAEELARSVRQGVIGYAQRLAQDPTGPTSFALAATLAGSGGLGISVGMSARAVIQGVHAANEKLLKEGWPIVARLRFIELYEDRATEVLRELLGAGDRVPAVFSVDAALEVGLRPLPRPDTPGYRGAEYDYVSAVSGATEEGRASIAFTVDTRRARTEVRSTSAQLGLVQGLIAEAEADRRADAKLGKTLFQVLVPAELDAFFGDSSAVVLEVDDATAPIPWEVLGVDHGDDQPNELPWSIRTRLIRKLRSQTFRENPTPAGVRAEVLVFGDPDCDRDRFPVLEGARREARMVASVLGSGKPIIEASARVMISALLDRPYSIIHIAGHGREDGGGVVMSAGLVLGADLVAKMRRVPDLVFVNCCHSARQTLGSGLDRDVPGRPARAATVASGLIRLGVRCVIATGWAVDDDAAERFAQIFYQGLKDGRSFIEATSQARETIWREFRDSNTWAAYQCYGDPDWTMARAEGAAGEPAAPVAGPVVAARPESRIVSPTTLQAALKSAVPRGGADDPTSPEATRRLDDLARAFGPAMGGLGEIAEAFAQAYGEVGQVDEAIDWYERAIAAEKGGASLRSLEQLCDLTARRAAERVEEAHRALSSAPARAGAAAALDAAVEAARAKMAGAEERVRALLTLNRTYERLSLLAAIAKRRAIVEQCVRGDRPGAAPVDAWEKAVEAVRDAYAVAETYARENRRGDLHYASLNRMVAELLLGAGRDGAGAASPAEVEAVRKNLADRAEQDPDFWAIVQTFELDIYVALAARALAGARARIEEGLRKLYGRID
ncbi:MAG TPA: CHAT domain-containing protein, partial [Polyangia bacterium]